jgi:hypothetical protein
MPGSKPKLLVLHQSALVYFIKIVVTIIFSNNFTYSVQETNGPIGLGQCRILSRFKDGDYSSVLPHCRKVMCAENHVENLGQEGYRSLG